MKYLKSQVSEVIKISSFLLVEMVVKILNIKGGASNIGNNNISNSQILNKEDWHN